MEIHSEQVTALERPIRRSVSDSIVGIRRYINGIVDGRADHAEQQPMNMRKDAVIRKRHESFWH